MFNDSTDCSEFPLQNKQRSGPLLFAGSSSLIRSCRYLIGLTFNCSNWIDCVKSDSWGELPVPPPDVIAKGTQNIIEFVRTAFKSGAFVLCGTVTTYDDFHSDSIPLNGRNLGIDKLLPLLQFLQEGKFRKLLILNLVNTFRHEK